MDMDVAVVEGIFTPKEHHRAAPKTFLSRIDILTLLPPGSRAVIRRTERKPSAVPNRLNRQPKSLFCFDSDRMKVLLITSQVLIQSPPPLRKRFLWALYPRWACKRKKSNRLVGLVEKHFKRQCASSSFSVRLKLT